MELQRSISVRRAYGSGFACHCKYYLASFEAGHELILSSCTDSVGPTLVRCALPVVLVPDFVWLEGKRHENVLSC